MIWLHFQLKLIHTEYGAHYTRSHSLPIYWPLNVMLIPKKKIKSKTCVFRPLDLHSCMHFNENLCSGMWKSSQYLWIELSIQSNTNSNNNNTKQTKNAKKKKTFDLHRFSVIRTSIAKCYVEICWIHFQYMENEWCIFHTLC